MNGRSSLRCGDDFGLVTSLFYKPVTICNGYSKFIIAFSATRFGRPEAFTCDVIAVVPHCHEQSRILFYRWVDRHKYLFRNKNSPLVIGIETLLAAEIERDANY